jgi:hypothetical protein
MLQLLGRSAACAASISCHSSGGLLGLLPHA